MANRMMRWFEYQHLPEHLQMVSKECCDLAFTIDINLPESAEKTAGLRKLLEAKDCFVRARLEADDLVCPESGLGKNICQHCKVA